MSSSLTRCHSCKLRSLIPDVCHSSNHVKSSLWNVIAIARKHLFEVVDGSFKVNESARRTSENFCHEERLRQEALHFPSACNSQFVFLAELVHTKNGDDIL